MPAAPDGRAEAIARLVLGDQLTLDHPALRDAVPGRDPVLMIEAPGEARHVWSHQARIVLFLAAMRHFARTLRDRGHRVEYVALDDLPEAPTLGERLSLRLGALGVRRLTACEPGEWRVLADVQQACERAGVLLELREDSHFLCSRAEFVAWGGRLKSLRMEFFYRSMRVRHAVLMRADGTPEGGQWNFDEQNRAGFPRTGPGEIPPPAAFEPDDVVREVIALVRARFAGHPGRLERFAWPVTRAQALIALERFVEHRLPGFGRHQDAMWTDEPFGWHALLSSSLNLKLLDPREVIAAAEAAWRRDPQRYPLACVEGFVRQVLGWREFIRGVYWLDMPGLAQANHYGHERPLPRWWWTGETRMRCMQETLGQTLEHGYAHHIQRLMITGNFALLAGLSPQQVADWYLAVYVDAVEWAELPNVAGMALFANGGRFTSKPYVASGAYVKRMSNYCAGCPYDPAQRTGASACPLTTLYWAFLDRHAAQFARNPRTSLMAKSVERLGEDGRAAVRAAAADTLARIDAL